MRAESDIIIGPTPSMPAQNNANEATSIPNLPQSRKYIFAPPQRNFVFFPAGAPPKGPVAGLKLLLLGNLGPAILGGNLFSPLSAISLPHHF